MTYRRGEKRRSGRNPSVSALAAVLVAGTLAFAGCKADGPGPKPQDASGAGGGEVGEQPDATAGSDARETGVEDAGSDVGEDVDVGVGELSVDPGQLEFRGLPHGDRDAKPISLRNVGGRELVVESLEVEEDEQTGLDEEVSLEGLEEQPPFAIEGGTHENVEVVYEPTDYAADRGTLTVTTESDAVDDVEVPFTTVLAEPDLRGPEYVRFGQVEAGGDETRQVVLYNRGLQDLMIEDVTYREGGEADPDFSFNFEARGEPPVTLGEGDAYFFDLEFAPSSDADPMPTRVGDLQIEWNDPAEESPHEITVTANRDQPCLQVSIGDGASDSLDFGSIGTETATEEIELLSCSLERDLTIESVDFIADGNGAFSLEDPPELPMTFTGGESLNLEVVADLDEDRAAYGNLSIRSNDEENNPVLIELRANVGE